MRVTLESKWFNAEWQWFVGVARGSLSEKDCLGLLSPGRLDWKLGSARQVDALFEYGAEGLHMTPLPQSPRALPPGRDWIYYEVSREQRRLERRAGNADVGHAAERHADRQPQRVAGAAEVGGFGRRKTGRPSVRPVCSAKCRS